MDSISAHHYLRVGASNGGIVSNQVYHLKQRLNHGAQRIDHDNLRRLAGQEVLDGIHVEAFERQRNWPNSI